MDKLISVFSRQGTPGSDESLGSCPRDLNKYGLRGGGLFVMNAEGISKSARSVSPPRDVTSSKIPFGLGGPRLVSDLRAMSSKIMSSGSSLGVGKREGGDWIFLCEGAAEVEGECNSSSSSISRAPSSLRGLPLRRSILWLAEIGGTPPQYAFSYGQLIDEKGVSIEY